VIAEYQRDSGGFNQDLRLRISTRKEERRRNSWRYLIHRIKKKKRMKSIQPKIGIEAPHPWNGVSIGSNISPNYFFQNLATFSDYSKNRHYIKLFASNPRPVVAGRGGEAFYW